MTVTYMFQSSISRANGAGPDLAPAAMPEAGPASAISGAVAPDDPVGQVNGADRSVPPLLLRNDASVGAAGSEAASTVASSAKLPVKWVPSAKRLILVSKARGGVGATSVAVNLALELQKSRGLFGSGPSRRVALVDFDIQFGNVASLLDLEDRGGMIDLARLGDEPDAQAVRNSLLTHPTGLKVLTAPRMAMPLEALDAVRVESIISALTSEHDYVVVDLPPALVSWLEPLLVQAERLLMVTDLAVPSVVCARRIIDLMREDNPELAVEIIVSREKKPMVMRKIHKDASSALGLGLDHWLPDEPKYSRQALDRGEPLVVLAPRCPWSKQVRRLAAEINTSAPVAKTV